MGDDFTNHQVFAGETNQLEFRKQLIVALKNCLPGNSFTEVSMDEAERIIAVGPTGRWICIYDSYGNGDDAHPLLFQQLSTQLSQFAPVVDIHMDDSAAVHFYLYNNGARCDQFGNAKSVGRRWKDKDEEQHFKGKPELWAGFVEDTTALKTAWEQKEATKILSDMAQILGWEHLLCSVGFTIDYDGVPVYYKEHLEDEHINLSAFDELYFRKTIF